MSVNTTTEMTELVLVSSIFLMK